MRKLLWVVLSVIFVFGLSAAGQNKNSNSGSNTASTNANKPKRGPVFRATSDQIKQAQAILRQRSFYTGEDTGKLNPDTRAGLKKFQEAEGIKVTGTLNKITLEKMAIPLTDRQKTM
ncbi:MAG TPA: peptidoglycan-binding domain-containing protein [Pyrinomonadaceae bacterium]|nr:peptidoglycan-binding domain-containing protein [Pyrinomonadaceae bacterium]